VYIADVLNNFVYVLEYTTPSAAALAAYNANAQMVIKAGQSVALVCNPTAGDNLQAMAKWISARGHYVEEGGELYLQIADGLHNVSTYVEVTNARFLDVRATAIPDLLPITGATFANQNETAATAGTVTIGGGAVLTVPVATGGLYFGGYIPTISFSGGGSGSGFTEATAVPVMSGGVVTGVTVTSGGTGYVSVPTATFSVFAGGVYLANIALSSALPARVASGFAVGGQNVQGNGGADALNSGMIVNTIAGDRLSFTTYIRMGGVALTAFTAPDPVTTLNLTPNLLVVPKCTIRAAQAGWDGVNQEGFMNATGGSKINLYYVGISYNGIASQTTGHVMLFAKDAGSEIYLRQYCVVAGTGEMVLRTFNYANIATYQSYLGGGQTGSLIWQGSGGGTLNATRTMIGSVYNDTVSCSAGGKVWVSSCVIAGGNIGLRTTYPDSSIDAAGVRISRCNLGVAPTLGQIYTTSLTSIRYCTTPIAVTGSNGGTAFGNPIISDNTNATVTPFAIQTTSGGVWVQSASPTFNPVLQGIGRFSSILTPSVPANSYTDYTITATGAVLGDFCVFSRTANLYPLALIYQPFVSKSTTYNSDGTVLVAGEVTLRIFNITSATITAGTPMTALVLVMRSA
jgi:hypothetical protein